MRGQHSDADRIQAVLSIATNNTKPTKPNKPMKATKRNRYVLSIDGGGIRGVIPAAILTELERRTGKHISEMFDLISGTSTGGILALGLAKKGADGKVEYSAEDLLKLYTEDSGQIFHQSFWQKLRSLWGLLSSKFPAKNIEKVLQAYFGEDLLQDAANNVVVTCYDIKTRIPYLLKSWKDEYKQVKMWQAARGTSAAPTFFPPLPLKGKVLRGDQYQSEDLVLIDGAVYVNNPALSAYVEAKKLYPNDFIVVVSMGTGQLTRPYPYRKARNWGVLGWAIPVLDCMLDGMSNATDYQMDAFLDKRGFYRFQVELNNASDDIDDASASNINKLRQEADLLLTQEAKEFSRLLKDLG